MKNKMLWIGMALISILGGVLALSNPVFASGIATLMVAWVFVLMGLLQILAGFRVEGTGAKIWSILLGALALYLGITMLNHPLQGMIALTTMIAILCLSLGAAKVILSFSLKDTRFFWLVLVSGVASVAVGAIILVNWPVSAVTSLGILLGVQLLSDGVSSMAMALSSDGEEATAT